MAPTPQELEQIYTQKAALSQRRQALVNDFAYAADLLDAYSRNQPIPEASASKQLRRARSSLIYLDAVRQNGSYTDAKNHSDHASHNSREQENQRTLLAQTDIAIDQARRHGHTDSADALEMLKSNFEVYSTQIDNLCAQEQDQTPPKAPSTAGPANIETHPTQQPLIAGPAGSAALMGASDAKNAAKSYQLIAQDLQVKSGDLRRGERDAAWRWAAEHMNMAAANYDTNAANVYVVNHFRTQRNETLWRGPVNYRPEYLFPTPTPIQNPVGDHASQELPAPGNRHENAQAGPATQPPPASNTRGLRR